MLKQRLFNGELHVDGEIQDNAFSQRADLTKVVIEQGVTSIGMKAFFGCKQLQSVHIPSTVRFILPDAFYQTTATLFYQGTKAEWLALTELEPVCNPVVCLDGKIEGAPYEEVISLPFQKEALAPLELDEDFSAIAIANEEYE